jgi:HAD superfamily hydrolase (TIGR01549 family)
MPQKVTGASLRSPHGGVTAHAGGSRSPAVIGARVRAVLFDLDGTLYRQRPLRLRMAAELLSVVGSRPLSGWRTMQVLKAYRQAQESLRLSPAPYDADAQVDAAAASTRVHRREVRRIVTEWMFERPLKHLPRYRVEGLLPMLDHLQRYGMQLGVLSDYAADEKLRALGLEGRFSPVLAAEDPDIRALKPDPRGFIIASARWQLDPAEVLMVGDRADVDAVGASAAGMRSVIIGRRPAAAATDLRTTFVSSFEQVRRVIDECC